VKKVFSAILNFFKKDWLTKILAILFAFVIWSYVIADQNPVREIVINDIPVSYQGSEELAARQLTVNTTESDAIPGVKVSMNAQQSLHKSLTKNNVNVYADLSSITSPGTHIIELRTTTPYTVQKINSIYPATITVVVEQVASKAIPVTCEFTGEVAAGKYISNPEIASKSVLISGPRSFVDQVARGVCVIDASVITEDIVYSYPVDLLGYDSEPIDAATYGGVAPYVNVKLSVLPTKDLVIDASTITVTNIAEGYEVSDISIEPSIVEIAGHPDDIGILTGIHIPFIDAAGSNTTITVDVPLPDLGDDIVYTEKNTVTATITITETQTTSTFSGIPIEVRGKQEGYSYKLSKTSSNVSVSGGLSVMQKVTSRSVGLYADVSGLSEGTHKIRVKADPITGIYQSDVSIAVTEVEVTIRKSR